MKRKYHNNEARKEFYETHHTKQDGRCAICGNKTRLVVDHNHVDGYMRGLLCYKHNAGLGMFDDNPEMLQRAVQYLAATATPPTFKVVKRVRKRNVANAEINAAIDVLM